MLQLVFVINFVQHTNFIKNLIFSQRKLNDSSYQFFPAGCADGFVHMRTSYIPGQGEVTSQNLL